MEIVRTDTTSTSISNMYVFSSHFPRVHLGENHAWYTMGSNEGTDESDATIRSSAIFLT